MGEQIVPLANQTSCSGFRSSVGKRFPARPTRAYKGLHQRLHGRLGASLPSLATADERAPSSAAMADVPSRVFSAYRRYAAESDSPLLTEGRTADQAITEDAMDRPGTSCRFPKNEGDRKADPSRHGVITVFAPGPRRSPVEITAGRCAARQVPCWQCPVCRARCSRREPCSSVAHRPKFPKRNNEPPSAARLGHPRRQSVNPPPSRAAFTRSSWGIAEMAWSPIPSTSRPTVWL